MSTTKNQRTLEQQWKAQCDLAERFAQEGLSMLADARSVFKLPNRDLGCIDEGVAELVGIHDAGSAILRPDEQTGKDYKGKVTGIWIHEGCGAAALAFSRLPDTEKVNYGNDVLRYAEYKARRLAGLLRVPFKGTIPLSQISRPPEFHNALATYYDATGLFNPNGAPELPKGFIISRRFLSDMRYAQEQVRLSFGIAAGSHGYGNRIKQDAPFFVFVLGDPRTEEFSADSMKREVTLLEEKRLRIVGLDVPIEVLDQK
jgi:hypothetical protein